MKQPKKFKRIKNIRKIVAGKQFLRMTIASDFNINQLVISDKVLVKGVPNKRNNNKKMCFFKSGECPLFGRAFFSDWAIGQENKSSATFPFTEKNLLFAEHLCDTQDIERYLEIIRR